MLASIKDNRLFPVSLLKLLLTITPVQILDYAIDILILRLEKSRPKMMQNLADMEKAVILFDIFDIPHRFSLTVGVPYPELKIVKGKTKKPDVVIKAPLEVLLDTLEGKSDGDTSFFTRGMEISGNVAAVVALRNVLEREEISLHQEFFSSLGNFSEPILNALAIIDGLSKKIQKRFAEDYGKKP